MGADASFARWPCRYASGTATDGAQPLHWCRQSGRCAAIWRSGHRTDNAQWPALPHVLREGVSGTELLSRLLLSSTQGWAIVCRTRCHRRTIRRRMPYRQHFAGEAVPKSGRRLLIFHFRYCESKSSGDVAYGKTGVHILIERARNCMVQFPANREATSYHTFCGRC